MPGFIIHIAVAKEYINKNSLKIKNINEFIKGIIAPDLNENMTDISNNKNISHYGKWGKNETQINISSFLQDTRVDIKQDFWIGYLIHLLTDYYFYNKYFKKETGDIAKNKDTFYHDYDCLNQVLIKKYKIEVDNLIDTIKKYVKEIKAEPKYLKPDKVINFIDEVSSINLDNKIKMINKNGIQAL